MPIAGFCRSLKEGGELIRSRGSELGAKISKETVERRPRINARHCKMSDKARKKSNKEKVDVKRHKKSRVHSREKSKSEKDDTVAKSTLSLLADDARIDPTLSSLFAANVSIETSHQRLITSDIILAHTSSPQIKNLNAKIGNCSGQFRRWTQ